MHPETIKAIETVHHHVQHNLPIKKELLFEVAPEYFSADLEQLDAIERDKILAKRPSLQTGETSVLGVFERPLNEKLEYYEELKEQEYKMSDLIYRKSIELSSKWVDFIDAKLSQGFHHVYAILENIEQKPTENRTTQEQDLYNDLQLLRSMHDDCEELIKLNRVRGVKKARELYVPEFVKNNEKLHAFWIQRWEDIVGNSGFIEESYFVPHQVSKESQLDKVLKEQQQFDLKHLMSESQKEIQEKLGGNEPIRGVDRLGKD